MGKLILGVDPGQKTGWALMESSGNRAILLRTGLLEINRSDSLPKQLASLFDQFDELILSLKPNEIAIETQFVKINVQSAFIVAMIRGVFMTAAARRDLEVFEYAPMEAKKAITGKGKATKEEVQKMCRLLFGFDSSGPLDITDALSLAFCHHNKQRVGAIL